MASAFGLPCLEGLGTLTADASEASCVDRKARDLPPGSDRRGAACTRRVARAGSALCLLEGLRGRHQVRRFLYNVRILRDATLGVQVIAVGNLTVGGNRGKRQWWRSFARELRDQGRNVAILFPRLPLQGAAVP